MKHLITTLIILLISLNLVAQTQVTVDFSDPAYYPLLKSKGSVFQEGLPDKPNMPTAMGMLSDLKVGAFRALVNQAGRQEIWIDNGEIHAAAKATYNTFSNLAIGHSILPMLTLYQTPTDFKAEGDENKAAPNDLVGYGEGIEKFVAAHSDIKPISWEVWNEPQSNSFLIADDNKVAYNNIYKTVAPRVRAADPDALIAGPAVANNTSPDVFMEAFVDNVISNDLPIDYFSVHNYNRIKQGVDRTAFMVNSAREKMGENFQTVPLIFTEYEFYPSGENKETIQANRELTIGAVKWLGDLSYFIEQTDLAFVTWNRYVHGEFARPGGLIDYEQNRRPIYWAFKLFGDMPTERKALNFSGAPAGVNGFASADKSKAGVLIWNDSQTTQSFTFSISNLPFANGTVKLYRVDANNSSYMENSASDALVLEWTKDISELNTVSLSIPGPGFIFLDIRPNIEVKEQPGLNAQYIRSWQWAGRNANGTITGDYGDFNWKSWTARAGVKGATGRGIAGVTIDDTPEKIKFKCEAFDINAASDNNALLGIRIDYVTDGNPEKSLLLHGTVYNGARTNELPWAGKGATADLVINKGAVIGNNELFEIDIDANAPAGWAASDARRAIITLWMENTGAESQAVLKMIGEEKVFGQVFHFPFDGNLNDVSGNEVALTNPHATNTFYSVNETGKYGQALSLTGESGTYLQIAQAGLLDPSQTDYTVCAWVKNTSATSHPSEHIILHQNAGGTGATRYLLACGGTDQLTATTFIGGGVSSSASKVPRNEWKHIAIVANHETANLKFYIDGVFDNEVTANAFEPSTHGFYLGQHRTGIAKNWQGLIDELYLFNMALSDEQVMQVKNNQQITRSENLVVKNSLRVYPNPAKDIIHIVSEEIPEKVSLYNIDGTLVLQESNALHINTTNLHGGYYLLQVSLSNGSVNTLKVIKK